MTTRGTAQVHRGARTAPLLIVICAAGAVISARSTLALSGSFPNASPAAAPATLRCDNQVKSGGHGVTTLAVELGSKSGAFLFSWDAMNMPDSIVVTYEGGTILNTGLVSGKGSRLLSYSGSSSRIMVTVTGTRAGTGWIFNAACPQPLNATLRAPPTAAPPRTTSAVSAPVCRDIPKSADPLACPVFNPATGKGRKATGTWPYEYDGCTFVPDAPLGEWYHDTKCKAFPTPKPQPVPTATPNTSVPFDCGKAPCDLHDTCYQTCGTTQKDCDNKLYEAARGDQKCLEQARAVALAAQSGSAVAKAADAAVAASAALVTKAASVLKSATARRAVLSAEAESAARVAAQANAVWRAKMALSAMASPWRRLTMAIELAAATRAAAAATAAWGAKVVLATTAELEVKAATAAKTVADAQLAAATRSATTLKATWAAAAAKFAASKCETAATVYRWGLSKIGEFAFRNRQRQVCQCCA